MHSYLKKTVSPMTTAKNPSEVSEVYLACRNGDVKFVQNYLKKLSDMKSNPNHFESTIKSTPLHAASFYGHTEIVQLLIEYGCDQSQVNGYGFTAYEEAANDEIRKLFKRPTDDCGMNRFRDETTKDCFDFVKRPKEHGKKTAIPVAEPQGKTKKIIPVQGYKTDAEKQVEVGYATTSIVMCQSKFGRFFTDRFQRGAPMSLPSMAGRLQEVIDKESIAKNHPQSEKANELLKKFFKH